MQKIYQPVAICGPYLDPDLNKQETPNDNTIYDLRKLEN